MSRKRKRCDIPLKSETCHVDAWEWFTANIKEELRVPCFNVTVSEANPSQIFFEFAETGKFLEKFVRTSHFTQNPEVIVKLLCKFFSLVWDNKLVLDWKLGSLDFYVDDDCNIFFLPPQRFRNVRERKPTTNDNLDMFLNLVRDKISSTKAKDPSFMKFELLWSQKRVKELKEFMLDFLGEPTVDISNFQFHQPELTNAMVTDTLIDPVIDGKLAPIPDDFQDIILDHMLARKGLRIIELNTENMKKF